MKTLLFLFISHLTFATYAADKMDMACITEFPSTSFVVREVDNNVILEVFNHNGLSLAPIYNGLVTPSDINSLTDKAKILTQLYTMQRFEWPREKCKREDPMVEACLGVTDLQEQNGHKVKAWSFTSSLVTEKSFSGKYNEYKFVLDINVDGKSYTLPMKYNESECFPDSILSEKLSKNKDLQ